MNDETLRQLKELRDAMDSELSHVRPLCESITAWIRHGEDLHRETLALARSLTEQQQKLFDAIRSAIDDDDEADWWKGCPDYQAAPESTGPVGTIPGASGATDFETT
jgi:hypothetical protein